MIPSHPDIPRMTPMVDQSNDQSNDQRLVACVRTTKSTSELSTVLLNSALDCYPQLWAGALVPKV
jgi:hypothetical protein